MTFICCKKYTSDQIHIRRGTLIGCWDIDTHYNMDLSFNGVFDLSFIVPSTKKQRKTFRNKASSCPDFKIFNKYAVLYYYIWIKLSDIWINK